MQGSETEDELLPSPEQNDDDFAGEDVEDTASDEEVEDDTLQTSEMRKVLRELQEDVFEQSYAPENLETSDAREPGGEDVEMHPPPRPAFTDLHDHSEEIPHHFSPVMDDLSLMLGLWCIESGVTNSSYSALLHILDEVNDVAQLRKLPRSLSTLKSNTKRQFPLLKMRRKRIPLQEDKLATDPAKQNRGMGLNSPSSWIYWIDLQDLFSTMLSSDEFRRRLHIGMAEFVTEDSQLWDSRSWASSIRASSGDFAHYPDKSPIFPSDFVYYRCDDHRCACHSDERPLHVGRVLEFGRDYRNETQVKGGILLRIQSALTHSEAMMEFQSLMSDSELILVEKSRRDYPLIPESHVIRREPSVYLDYVSGGIMNQPATAVPSSYLFFVRRIFNPQRGEIRPLQETHPPRGELEIAQFGRSYLVDTFKSGKCISVPYNCFVDGFGLYRRAYRSLLGIYVIPAGLDLHDQSRLSNIFPVTLGPHGSDTDDVVNALTSLRHLDRGVSMHINGVETVLCAFTLAFLGDMQQQNENAGIKRHNATKGCRFCLIDQENQGNLQYDHVKNGRYHYQTAQLRQIADSKSSRTAKERFCKTWGITVEPPPLAKLTPALDLILSRPADPVHSEFQGIARMAHHFLLDAILTAGAKQLYAREIRKFPFPPGWSRLQSPLHHLQSYQMQEHGRVSVIIPLLLRCWLKDEHVNPKYKAAVGKEFMKPAPEAIVSVYAALAKINSVTMTYSVTTDDRENLETILLNGRRLFQRMVEAAVMAYRNSSRSASEQSQSLMGTPQPRDARSVSVESLTSVFNAQGNVEDSNEVLSGQQSSRSTKRSNEFKALLSRPNVHVAKHFNILAEEYGVPYAANVFAGEMTHKEVLILTSGCLHLDSILPC
ncbi:hypothetical protein VTN31DRAFT_6319 [Thermomyces dupontii]|uniref:uncharacterized protein n=1 Tax=Talaromyces thermophilus TaxID=28565 RepID=UPI003742FEB7